MGSLGHQDRRRLPENLEHIRYRFVPRYARSKQLQRTNLLRGFPRRDGCRPGVNGVGSNAIRIKPGDLQIHPQYGNGLWLWVAPGTVSLQSQPTWDYDDRRIPTAGVNVHWHCVAMTPLEPFQHL